MPQAKVINKTKIAATVITILFTVRFILNFGLSVDSFSQKLEITLNKNEENLFNSEDVKQLLIETVGL